MKKRNRFQSRISFSFLKCLWNSRPIHKPKPAHIADATNIGKKFFDKIKVLIRGCPSLQCDHSNLNKNETIKKSTNIPPDFLSFFLSSGHLLQMKPANPIKNKNIPI